MGDVCGEKERNDAAGRFAARMDRVSARNGGSGGSGALLSGLSGDFPVGPGDSCGDGGAGRGMGGVRRDASGPAGKAARCARYECRYKSDPAGVEDYLRVKYADGAVLRNCFER